MELFKLLQGKAARRALDLARRNHILELILPEAAESDWEGVMDDIEALPIDPVLRLARLIEAAGEEAAEAALRRLTTSNEDRKRALALIRWADALAACALEDAALRRHMSAVGRRYLEEHLTMQAARAQSRSDDALEARVHRCREILDAGHPLVGADLAVNGKDLMAATGLKGKAVGDTLAALLALVLEDPSLNDKERLLDEARSLASAS